MILSVSDILLQSCFIFPSQMGAVVKTGVCQTDVVLAITSKKTAFEVADLFCLAAHVASFS